LKRREKENIEKKRERLDENKREGGPNQAQPNI